MRKFFVPPSGENPAAMAIASRIVDLPDPFSPASTVTPGWKHKDSIALTAGTDSGNSDRLSPSSRRITRSKNGASLMRRV